MDLKITVTHPTERTDGRALPLDELDHITVELGIRDEDRFYSPLDPAQPAIPVVPNQILFQREIDNGEWFVRVKWFDKKGKVSTASVSSILVGESAAPPKAGSVVLELV